jgi:hypothetical protein
LRLLGLRNLEEICSKRSIQIALRRLAIDGEEPGVDAAPPPVVAKPVS